MEDYRRQGGIQQLLVAEQEGRQIVNAARSAKMARLKQAKVEADQEVTRCLVQTEQDFQKKLRESSEYSGDNVKCLEKEMEEKIHHLKLEGGRASRDVVNMLLKHVKSVKV